MNRRILREYLVLQSIAKSYHLNNLNYQFQIYMEKRLAITRMIFIII